MSEIGDGIGTAIEGGLIAGAVEREGKDGGASSSLDHGHFSEQACLNCGTRLIGAHCHECGQPAHLHRTIGAFLHDLLHSALHLDGKIWRTLPMLAIRPGHLTRRYIEGQRAQFVSPMALFLFSIFLMFAIFQIAGLSAPTEFRQAGLDTEQLERAGEEAREQASARRADLEAELATLPVASPRRAEIASELEGLDRADAIIGSAEDFVLDDGGERGVTIPGEGSGIAWIDAGLAKWRENPGLMLYKLQTNFYKFSWLLIPLSLPFVWLLFAWKRQFRGYDHAVFVTYSLSFVTLLFIVLALLGLAGVSSGWLIPAAVLIPPIHIYKQLRHAYSLSRLSAAWRLLAMLLFITIVLVLFLQLLVLLGLMG